LRETESTFCGYGTVEKLTDVRVREGLVDQTGTAGEVCLAPSECRRLHPHRPLSQHVEDPPLLLHRPLHDEQETVAQHLIVPPIDIGLDHDVHQPILVRHGDKHGALGRGGTLPAGAIRQIEGFVDAVDETDLDGGKFLAGGNECGRY